MKTKLKKPYIKNLKQPKKILAAGAVFVLFIVAFAAAYYLNGISDNKAAGCNLVRQQSAGLYEQKKYQKAYEKLQQYTEICGNLENKQAGEQAGETDQKLQALQFEGELARSAYLSGDKAQAKTSADKVLKANKTLTHENREQIPGYIDFFIDMHTIQQGQEIFIPEVRQ